MERETHAVYVISVAAEIAGVHPQTLRIYERQVLELESEVIRLRHEVEQLRNELLTASRQRRESNELVPLHQAITLFGRTPSIFRDKW